MSATGIKVLVALAIVAGCVFGFQWYIGSVESAADKVGYDRAVGEYRERENKALKDALADKARLENELQGVSRDAREKTAALVGAQRAAVDAGERLRRALAALRRGAQCPAATSGGSPAADPTDSVLADVQRRLDEYQETVAGFADASRIAGLACERSYDALK